MPWSVHTGTIARAVGEETNLINNNFLKSKLCPWNFSEMLVLIRAYVILRFLKFGLSLFCCDLLLHEILLVHRCCLVSKMLGLK